MCRFTDSSVVLVSPISTADLFFVCVEFLQQELLALEIFTHKIAIFNAKKKMILKLHALKNSLAFYVNTAKSHNPLRSFTHKMCVFVWFYYFSLSISPSIWFYMVKLSVTFSFVHIHKREKKRWIFYAFFMLRSIFFSFLFDIFFSLFILSLLTLSNNIQHKCLIIKM